MDITLVEARDLPDAWFQCVDVVQERGRKYVVERGSYEGQKRWELDCLCLHVRHPGTRPLVPDMPPGLDIPAPTTMEYVEQYLPYVMTDAVKPGEQYTYGQYLAPQIEKVIAMYRGAGHGTNQAYMAVGDASSIDLTDPPCLRGIDTRIRDNRLHFFLYFRSWDLWGGLPANLAAIQLLKEYMGGEIGVEDGEIVAFSKGLHLYEFVWDLAKLRTQR